MNEWPCDLPFRMQRCGLGTVCCGHSWSQGSGPWMLPLFLHFPPHTHADLLPVCRARPFSGLNSSGEESFLSAALGTESRARLLSSFPYSTSLFFPILVSGPPSASQAVSITEKGCPRHLSSGRAPGGSEHCRCPARKRVKLTYIIYCCAP